MKTAILLNTPEKPPIIKKSFNCMNSDLRGEDFQIHLLLYIPVSLDNPEYICYNMRISIKNVNVFTLIVNWYVHKTQFHLFLYFADLSVVVTLTDLVVQKTDQWLRLNMSDHSLRISILNSWVEREQIGYAVSREIILDIESHYNTTKITLKRNTRIKKS